MKTSGILVGILAILFALLAVSTPVSGEEQTLTFQEGDGGAYSSTWASEVHYFSTTNYGSMTTMAVSVDVVVADFTPGRRAFIRFPDIIGENAGQIPVNSTIQSASLTLSRVGATTHAAGVWTITAPWDEYTITGEDSPGYDDPKSTVPSGGQGAVAVTVTAAVQAWASGQANWGLVVSAGYSATTWSEAFYSDDAPTAADRPKLSVTFTEPLTPVEPSTWGKVKALYR